MINNLLLSFRTYNIRHGSFKLVPMNLKKNQKKYVEMKMAKETVFLIVFDR